MEENKKTDYKQIIFLILLVVAICALLFSGISIVRYSDMLKNPIGYNLKEFNIKTCTCINSEDKTVIIDAVNYIPPKQDPFVLYP
jgi:hypothetical protein